MTHQKTLNLYDPFQYTIFRLKTLLGHLAYIVRLFKSRNLEYKKGCPVLIHILGKIINQTSIQDMDHHYT